MMTETPLTPHQRAWRNNLDRARQEDSRPEAHFSAGEALASPTDVAKS